MFLNEGGIPPMEKRTLLLFMQRILHNETQERAQLALKQLQKRLAAGSTAHAVALKDAIDRALVIK